MPERPIKVIKKQPERPNHPLYNSFTLQVSAGLGIARKIKEDLKSETPVFVQRFLDEFDKKVA